MTWKVKNLRRNSVYYTSEFLGASNLNNVIVINPDAPADIVGKLYRNPDDANTWIATQTPTADNQFVLQYWAWFYDLTHTCKQYTKLKGEQIQTGIWHIVADLDFSGDNFIESLIESVRTDDIQIPTGKILACIWWLLEWWTIEWPFAGLGAGWLNRFYGVDATAAPFMFMKNRDIVWSQLAWWSFDGCTLEDCQFWEWEYEWCYIIDSTVTGVWSYSFVSCYITADFLSGIPAWSNVTLQDCNIEWSGQIWCEVVMVNCYSISGCGLEVVGSWQLATAGLTFIVITNTNGWWIDNVGETIDNSNFTNLTEQNTQTLFEEVDSLLWSGNFPDFYIYKGAAASGRLYNDWEDLYAASNVWQGIRNIWFGGDALKVSWWVNGASYNISNYYLRAYKTNTPNDQIGNLSFTKSVWNDFTIWLPKYLKDVYLIYNNSFGVHNPFYAFTNTGDSYPRFELAGRATLEAQWTQTSFQVGGVYGDCDLHIYVRDFATLSGSGIGMFKLYDASSRIHIHVFDNATISGNIVATTFVSGSGSPKDNIFIHVYSPTANISEDLVDPEQVTVVFHGIFKPKTLPINSLQAIDDVITDVTWDDTLKQATYTGTFTGLSVGDWVEVSGMTPSQYNALWQIIDFPTMTEMTIQFPSWTADPWAYVSGGTWRLKTVTKLWSNRNVGIVTWYIGVWSWFTRWLTAQLAANSNIKSIKLIAQDRYNGNVATIYKNNDIDTSGDAVQFAVEWIARMTYANQLQANAKEMKVTSAPASSIWLLSWTNGMAIQNTDILLVLDGDWLQDIQITNLYCNPV